MIKKPLTPHGPGFRFLDTIEVDLPNQKLIGRKWLDPQMSFFADHFPDNPVMPGVLMLECAAQAAGALWDEVRGITTSQRHSLAQVNQFRITRPVFPDQTLTVEACLEKNFISLAQFNVKLSVDGQSVANGTLIMGTDPGTES